MTKVSICIPQFNRIDALRLVLDDLVSQTYKDFELIIVDDASTENTDQVVQEFNDPRICYIKNARNLGLYPNFNRCLQLAQGEYVAIYHNHDRYSREIVEKSVRMLDEYPEVGLVHTGTITQLPGSDTVNNMVRMWPRVFNGRKFAEKLIWRWDSPIHQPTVMARRMLYDKVGFFDDNPYGSCADSAVWIKMSLLSNVGYIPEPLMWITQRASSDKYGSFQWYNIKGMVNVHILGCDLLYHESDPVKYNKILKKLQFKHDRYFLVNLLYCLSKDRDDLLMEGIDLINEKSDRWCKVAANFLDAQSFHIKSSVKLASIAYKKMVYLKIRWESMLGKMICTLRRRGI